MKKRTAIFLHYFILALFIGGIIFGIFNAIRGILISNTGEILGGCFFFFIALYGLVSLGKKTGETQGGKP